MCPDLINLAAADMRCNLFATAIVALLATRRSDPLAVEDTWAALPQARFIETIGGVAASLTFAIALRLTARRDATAAPSHENDR